MALSNLYLVWSDETSASPSFDSTSNPWKPASGNSSAILRVIQRSDQKLGPFRTGTLVWSDETSASPSGVSTSTPRKTASGNSSIILRVIQRLDQKLWCFRIGNLVWSDETSASPSSDSTSTSRKTESWNSSIILEGDPTVRSKVMDLSNQYSGLERQDLHLN